MDTNTTIMSSYNNNSIEAINRLMLLLVILHALEGDASFEPPPKVVNDNEYPIGGQHTSTLPTPNDNLGVVMNFDVDVTGEEENHSSTSPEETMSIHLDPLVPTL